MQLPSMRTLYDYSHYIESRVGFQPDVAKMLKEECTKKDMYSAEHRSFVRVLFDEVKIKEDRRLKGNLKGVYRLSDDVTKLNSDLINKMAKNDQMSSTWYFNGHVYGQVGGVKVIVDFYYYVEAKTGDIMFGKNYG